MLSMNRVVGLVKIMLAELVGIFAVAGFFGELLAQIGTASCPPSESSIDLIYVLFLLVGLGCLWWVVRNILRPKELNESFQPTMKMGGFVMTNPFQSEVDFPFCSTHPSYVLVDLLTTGVMLMFYLLVSSADCGSGRALVGMLLGVGIPVLRLVSWYGLGRRVGPDVSAGAWRPVAILYVIMAVPIIAGVIVSVNS